MKDNILITGVNGFIGRNVARYFAETGWSVIGIDKSKPDDELDATLSFHHVINLPDAKLMSFLQEYKPSACIHCAGRSSIGDSLRDPVPDFYDSAVVTFELLNALRMKAPQCRVLFVSSAAVYGNPRVIPVSEDQPPQPISPYGFHKWQCEQICLEFASIYGLHTASARIFSAYGRGLRRQVVWDICEKLSLSKKLVLQGTGKESRDFIHVSDISRALMTIVEYAPMKGEQYNVACGHKTEINELALIILKLLGINTTPVFDGIVPPGTPLNWEADISKIISLGYSQKISLQEGINDFINWCRGELSWQ